MLCESPYKGRVDFFVSGVYRGTVVDEKEEEGPELIPSKRHPAILRCCAFESSLFLRVRCVPKCAVF